MANYGTVNKITLIGNLGAAPEAVPMRDGKRLVKLAVATGSTWTNKETGAKEQRTDWHNVAIFNEALGKIAMDNLKKGDKVYVEGEMRHDKYVKEGVEHWSSTVVIDAYNGNMQMLGAPKGTTAGQPAAEGAAPDGEPTPWDDGH